MTAVATVSMTAPATYALAFDGRRGRGRDALGTRRSNGWAQSGGVRSGAQAAQGVPVTVWHLLAAAAAVVAVALIIATGIALSGFQRGPVAGQSVTVQAGQSLWDVAAATGSTDVSQTVMDIAELNGLTHGDLEAGQVLVLPAQ